MVNNFAEDLKKALGPIEMCRGELIVNSFQVYPGQG